MELRAFIYALSVTRLYLRAWSYALIRTRLELCDETYALRVTRMYLRAWRLRAYFFMCIFYFVKLFLIFEKLFGHFYGPVWTLQYSQCFGEIVGPS